MKVSQRLGNDPSYTSGDKYVVLQIWYQHANLFFSLIYLISVSAEIPRKWATVYFEECNITVDIGIETFRMKFGDRQNTMWVTQLD